MDLNLSGRTALVTGASRGIGLAVAQRFASEGVRLHLAARSAELLESAAADLRQNFGVAVAIHASDLSLPAERERLAREVSDVDILVNNAGAIPSGTIEELDDKTWRSAWELKLFGFIDLTRTYFARMKEKRRGVIINVIGAAGERPDYNYVAGSAANAALMSMTRALGGVSPDFNLRVVGINPGGVATERRVAQAKRNAQRRFGDESRWQEFYANMPFGKPQSPEQISALAAFLASDLAGYITGTTITADGGVISRGQHH